MKDVASKEFKEGITNRALADAVFRCGLVVGSHLWFFLIYLASHITYPLAFFHHEMFAMTENESLRLAVVMAFRGSGKSTIMNLSYVLWAILGKQQKKFIVIISKTRKQAGMHFENIKYELENNSILKNDLGPFKIDDENMQWGAYSLVVPNFNARIICVAARQSLRGLKHGSYRPDLIICDDVEDMSSVQTIEQRNRLYEWFMDEVLPLGDNKTKIVLLGNLLDRDSLLMRIQSLVGENPNTMTFRAYPIVDDNEKILWPGKFATEESVNNLASTVGCGKTWHQEYLLKFERIQIRFNFSREDDHEWTEGEIERLEKRSHKENPNARHVKGFVISHPSPACQAYEVFEPLLLNNENWKRLNGEVQKPPLDLKEEIKRVVRDYLKGND